MVFLLYDIIITSIVADTLDIVDGVNDTIELINNLINTGRNTVNKFSVCKLPVDLPNPRCYFGEVRELTNTFYMNAYPSVHAQQAMHSQYIHKVNVNYNCDFPLAYALNKGKVLFFLDCFNNATDQLKYTGQAIK